MQPPIKKSMSGYVRIRDAVGDEDPVEVPTEQDSTLLLSTVVAQFPGSVGLRYQGGTGLWRACRMIEGVIDPPIEGWDGIEFSVVKQGVKRGSVAPAPAIKGRDVGAPPSSKQLVLASEANKQVVPFKKEPFESKFNPELKFSNIEFETPDAEVRQYFEGFGELEKFTIVRKEGNPKGYGFMKFKTLASTNKVRHQSHTFQDRKVEVCPTREAQELLNKERTNHLVVAKLTNESSGKDPTGSMIPDIMIANLPYVAGDAEIRSYFEGFGELETFSLTYDNLGKPKGFGFMKFTTVSATRDCLATTHTLHNRILDVSPTKRAMEMLQVGYGIECMPNDSIPTKLFVGRLPHETTEADLYSIFKDYSIKCVNMPSNGSHSCGFVTLTSIAEAYRAMNDSFLWKGKCLNVSAADKRAPLPGSRTPKSEMNKTELNDWMLDRIQRLSQMTPEQRMQAKQDAQRQELMKTTKNATAYDYGYGGRGDIGNTNQQASNPSWGGSNPQWGSSNAPWGNPANNRSWGASNPPWGSANPSRGASNHTWGSSMFGK